MSTNNRLTISTVTPGYWWSAMSSRPLVSAICPVPPATDPVGPLIRHTGVELATAHHFTAHSSPRRVRSSSVEAADKPGESPRLYGTVQGSPREMRAHPHRDRTAFKNWRPSQSHRGRYRRRLRLLGRQRLWVFL